MQTVRWGFILVLLATACRTDEPGEIAGSSTPSEAAPALDSVPAFVVTGGLFQGDSIHFFSVAGASFLTNGYAAVVLGRGQNQIVLLDQMGQVVQVMGGRGGGPHQFSTVPMLARAGDQLFAFTNNLHVQVGVEGLGDPSRHAEFGRTQEFLGMFSSQEFLTTPHPRLRWRTRDTFLKGLDSTPYYVWSRDMIADTLPGPASPPVAGFWIEPRPFVNSGACMPELLHAAADSTLLIAQASAGLLLALHRTGALDTLYSSQDRGRVTPEMVAGARELVEAELMESGSVGSFFAQVGDVGDPLKSAWSDMLFDGDQLVWLRRAPQCFVDSPVQQWDVVDLVGRTLAATIELPPEQRMLAVSPSLVLMLSRDELEVERLSAFRILR